VAEKQYDLRPICREGMGTAQRDPGQVPRPLPTQPSLQVVGQQRAVGRR
jgi:hypothetical protein